MKVAVSALGPSLDDQVDERFGRAKYLLIVETPAMRVKSIDNSENCNAMQGAGIGAAELVSDNSAEAVITGHLGPKAYRALSMVGISGYRGVGMTVKEAVSAFEDGTLAELESGPSHKGMD